MNKKQTRTVFKILGLIILMFSWVISVRLFLALWVSAGLVYVMLVAIWAFFDPEDRSFKDMLKELFDQ